jgi:hypothetical protein
MTPSTGLQASRFEMKYIVDERTAAALRDFVRPYLEPDANAEEGQEARYHIHSLYLDSDDLALYRASQDGVRDRFKLRVRWYGERPEQAFFEVKRRVDKVVLKQRAGVEWVALQRLLDGGLARPEDLLAGDPRAMAALDRFAELSRTINASGQLVVSYEREAYVTPGGNTARLTFDRGVASRAYSGCIEATRTSAAFHPRVGGVIVEMKFTDRFPAWMEEATQVFALARRRVPKYVLCVMGAQTVDYALFQRKGVNGVQTAAKANGWALGGGIRRISDLR